jgi:hypothetical protein
MPNEIEILRLRTGIMIYYDGMNHLGRFFDRIETEYGMEYLNYLNKQVRKFLRMTWCLSKTTFKTNRKSFDRWNVIRLYFI